MFSDCNFLMFGRKNTFCHKVNKENIVAISKLFCLRIIFALKQFEPGLVPTKRKVKSGSKLFHDMVLS